VNAAQWMGNGKAPVVSVVAEPSEIKAEQAQEVEAKTEAVALRAPVPSSSLAAFVSCSEDATKENAAAPVIPVLEAKGEAWFLVLEGREYRVTGLEKTLGSDHLKIGLRVVQGERFHLDQVDLMRDAERRRFIERAAEETGLAPELLKRDLGRLLLAVETAQAEMLKPGEAVSVGGNCSPEGTGRCASVVTGAESDWTPQRLLPARWDYWGG